MYHSYIIVIILSFLLSVTQIALANTYSSIEYNIDLENIKNSVLKVEAIFEGELEDKLLLTLPSIYGNANYIEQIKNIKVAPNYKLDVVRNDDGLQAIISMNNHLNNQVKITYEVHQKVSNPSNVHEAIIREDLIHALGHGIFAIPDELNEVDKLKFTVNWLNINESWNIISSHGVGNNLRLSTTAAELLNAIYLAGKTRIYNIGSDTQPIFLSLYDDFDMKDEEIAFDLSNIINDQRIFFKDFDFPYYLISLIKEDNPRLMTGTRLHNSFTASLPMKMQKTDYYTLFAHEHLHNWIGGKIQNNQDEELNYWWTEGFTDFYSRLIAARSKGISKKVFIKEVNQFLRAYYLSTVNQESNLKIKENFWNSYDFEKLSYYRGFVFAMYLNNMIQKENSNNSLDNVMRDLCKIASKEQFSYSLFKEIVHRYVKNGIDIEILNFIDKGNLIPLKDVNLPIEKVLMGRYDIGFNKDACIEDNIIREIDINSNAYKSGLRNEQKVTDFGVPNGAGDPDQMITINTEDKTFQFKPEHCNKIEVYQLKINTSSDEKQFNKFFNIS